MAAHHLSGLPALLQMLERLLQQGSEAHTLHAVLQTCANHLQCPNSHSLAHRTRHDPEWGKVVKGLLDLANGLTDDRDSQVPPMQPDLVDACMVVGDKLLDRLHTMRPVPPAGKASRSSDGADKPDLGVFPLFKDCKLCNVKESLQSIDLVEEAKKLDERNAKLFWMCDECERPTSDEPAEHMWQKHRSVHWHMWQKVGALPPPVRMQQVLELADRLAERHQKRAALLLHTMETPIYLASNKAMREWNLPHGPEAYKPWQPYAHLLDQELLLMDRFEGSVYRGVHFRLPEDLYKALRVVTWNNPTCASEDPRQARLFLGSKQGGCPVGTLFVIRSITGHRIAAHSLHPEEQEVVFRAGTQFQVQPLPSAGMKQLLEVAMRCSLQDVAVYELHELTLDSWMDLKDALPPSDVERNRGLLDLIDQQVDFPVFVRGAAKWATAQRMTELMEFPKGTALHMAVAVPNNMACVHLVCSQLRRDDPRVWSTDSEGRTAFQVAMSTSNEDAAVYLLQRFSGWQEHLSPEAACQMLPAACQTGDKELVTELRGVAMASPCTLEASLVAACQENRLKVVELLVGWQAIDPADGNHMDARAALLAASKHGHMACVEHLVKHKAPVDQAVDQGGTALMAAAHNGHLDCVKYLLSNGADVQLTNDSGWTAMMLASTGGHLDCVEYLAGAGSRIDARTNDDFTALMAAAQHGHQDCVQYLISKGAPLEAATKTGGTALLLASCSGYLRCVEYLVAANAQVNPAGLCPLRGAAQSGHLACVKCLFENRAQLDRGNSFSPLMVASQEGRLACVEYLIDQRADVGRQTREAENEGTTALILAAMNGHLACMKSLVGGGAQVEQFRNDRTTALLAAASGGHLPCLKYLLDCRADIRRADDNGMTALHRAAQYGHLASVEYLVGQGAPETCSQKGLTVLMSAAGGGFLECVKYLLGRGGASHVDQMCIGGTTALMYASIEGHRECVEYLVTHHAEVGQTDHTGGTALMVASRAGHVDCVRYLVEQSANVQQAEHDGITALMYAALGGHLDCICSLLEHNASLEQATPDGHTALLAAAAYGHLKCVQYLVGCNAQVERIYPVALQTADSDETNACACHLWKAIMATSQWQGSISPSAPLPSRVARYLMAQGVSRRDWDSRSSRPPSLWLCELATDAFSAPVRPDDPQPAVVDGGYSRAWKL